MKSTHQKETIRVAKFNVGDIVVHQRQGYRAVVIDVDPLFQASGRYNPQAIKRSFAQQNPWYRLLVDGCSQATYVEEPLLEFDSCHNAIENPQISYYLVLKDGNYYSSSNNH